MCSMKNKSVESGKDAEKKKSIFSLNYEMLPFKLHFFLFCGAMSGVLPYKTVFSKDRLGLTGTDLAALCTTQQFIVIFTKPAIGAIVDYFNKLKLVIIVITILQAGFYLCLIAIPPIDQTLPGVSGNNSHSLNPVWFEEHRVNLMNCNISDQSGKTMDTSSECYTCMRTESTESVLPQAEKDNLTLVLLLHERNDSDCGGSLTYCSTEFNEAPDMLDNDHQTFCIEEFDFIDFNKSVQTYTSDIVCDFFKLYHNVRAIPVVKVLRSIQDVIVDFPECQDNFQILVVSKYNDPLPSKGKLLEKDHNSLYSTYQYWLFSLCLIIGGIGSNALFTLSDTACYESLQKTGADYGKQRLWGAVSWGLLAPLAGYLNDLFTTGNEPNYIPGFILMFVLIPFEIINISRVDLMKPNLSSSILKDIKIVFSSREFILFDFFVFMIGVFTGLIWFYLMIYIESLGGSRLLLGLVHACQCFLGELPLMFLSGWVVKKLGHINTLAVTLLAFFIRFQCYSFLQNPWYVLPIECLHGFTYGLFYAAMTAYGKLSARPGTEATTQAILCCTYEGLGAGVGTLLGGLGFDIVGSRQTYFIASLVSLGAAAFHIIGTLSLKSRKKRLDVKTENEC